MRIKIKRVYEKYAKEDGFRVLVDRLWPRGISKENAGFDLWLKEIAPSNELRKWFNHDPAKWELFKKKYFKELRSNSEALIPLIEKIGKTDLILLYSSKEERYNNAAALKEFIENYISPER